MQELILKPNQKLDEHLEHFNPDTKKWELCNSIEDNQCVFIETPHRIAFGKPNCICGKSMNYLIKQNGHLIRHFKEDEIDNNIEKMIDSATEWKRFYKKVFGLDCDFSNIKIPKQKKGFNRLIIVAKGLTMEQLYKKCEELFRCHKFEKKPLDQIIKSKRKSTDGVYTVLIRDEIEADNDLRNMSTKDLENKDILGITLEERLLLELKHYEKTGKHLDTIYKTLCTGSYYRDGDVIGVSWFMGTLFVDWFERHSYGKDMCCREIIY